MEKASGLIERLKKYPEMFRIINNLYKFSKGKISGDELFNSLEPYIGPSLELFEKIAPILKSDEIWGDGRTVYKTKVSLESGEVVDVTVNRSIGFVVIDGYGKREAELRYLFSVESDKFSAGINATTTE